MTDAGFSMQLPVLFEVIFYNERPAMISSGWSGLKN
jgi:hypothetical protein